MTEENTNQSTETTEAPRAEAKAPQIDLDAIVNKVKGSIDTGAIEAKIKGEVVKKISSALTGEKEKEKIDPIHEAFLADGKGFSRALIETAKDEAKAELKAESEQNSAMFNAIENAAAEYPQLRNFPGEIMAEFVKEQNKDSNRSRAEIMQKAVESTTKRLEKAGAIKKISPEDVAAQAGHLPGGRGVPQGAYAAGDTTSEQSANDFLKQRAEQARAFREPGAKT